MVNTPAATGFPWNKVEAARKYLLAMKPWLNPMATATKVVPVDFPPVSGEGWITAPQVDTHGRIYLDRSFVQSVPLHVLAGALEHEYAKISRNVMERLSWLEGDDWEQIATPAFQLEIMDAMESEARGMTQARIEQRLSRSQQFTLYDMEDWDVKGPPSLAEAGAVSPSLLGLPSGLSAETYAQVLAEARQYEPVPEDDDESEGEQEQANVSAETPEGLVMGLESDEQSDMAATESGNSSSGDDSGDEESQDGAPAGSGKSGSSKDDGDPSDSSQGGGEESDDEEDVASSGSEDQDGDKGQQGDQDGGDEGGSGESPDDGESESEEGSGADGGDSDGGDSGDEGGEGEDSKSEGGGNEPPSQMSKILEAAGGGNALRARIEDALTSGEGQSWSKSIPHYKDEFAARVEPPREDNAPPTPQTQLNEALSKMSELMLLHARDPGSNLSRQNLELAQHRLNSLGLSWERHLSRVVSSCLTSERIKGASDLTYASPNPNQPEVGVRLMGMTDYSPTVTIIQDVSGSMTNLMSAAMDAMAELMVAITGRLSARTTWVTFSSSIVAVGQTPTMSSDVMRQWQYGGGGTDLGLLIEPLMGKGKVMKWKNHRLEAPDLLVVSTDGIFRWPETRPSRAHKLLVVIYDKKHYKALPEWVDKDREVVLAAPREGDPDRN